MPWILPSENTDPPCKCGATYVSRLQKVEAPDPIVAYCVECGAEVTYVYEEREDGTTEEWIATQQSEKGGEG